MNLDAIPPELLTPPRTVTTRKTGYTHLPMLAVRKGEYLTEDGLTGPVEDIDWRGMSPHYVIGYGLANLVWHLNRRYRDDPSWQWLVHSPDGSVDELIPQQKTIVNFFGFQQPADGPRERRRGSRHEANHYFYCLDAMTFYANDSYSLANTTLRGLLEWGVTIRQYCQEENLPLRATSSGIAAQYLRDLRFYPTARRKVPKWINAQVRDVLPGNHYRLHVSTKTGMRYSALVIDQKRAHHYHAEHTPMPNANTLFGRGDTKGLQNDSFTLDQCGDFYGLYHLRLSLPRGRHPHWSPILNQRKSGEGYFVFSNELSMLRDFGYRVTGITALWGSYEKDSGLPAYARHCQSQLDKYNDAPWLKPLLLATYGLLAMKPRTRSAIYRQAKHGEPTSVLAGGVKQLHGLLIDYTKGQKIDPAIANVLQRGLIEAATRAESLGLADYLTQNGQWVLHVYADAVIVEDNPERPLPFLPEPWRIKQRLTDWHPINEQSYVSVEDTKLPGIGRESVLRGSLGTVGYAARPDFKRAHIIRQAREAQNGNGDRPTVGAIPSGPPARLGDL